MSRIGTALVVTALGYTLAGCSVGSYRSFDISDDMSTEDLEHYKQAGRRPYPREFEAYKAWQPLSVLPLVYRERVGYPDSNPIKGALYRFGDNAVILPLLSLWSETAAFDQSGRNLLYDSTIHTVFGIVKTTSEIRRGPEGERQALGGFDILWGLIGRQKTMAGAAWSILWIPFGPGWNERRNSLRSPT